MPEYTTWMFYSLLGLGLAWLCAGVVLLRMQSALVGRKWLWLSWCVWPLSLTDEAVALASDSWLSLYGLTDWVPVLLMTLFYRALKPRLIAQVRPVKWVSWLPVCLCLALQLPLALSGLPEKQRLLAGGPVGHPLDFWPVYAIALLVCFGVLVLGLLITETVQNYHKYLNQRVTCPTDYKIRYVVPAMSSMVAIGGILTLLVTAVTFGFLNIMLWQNGVGLIFAIATLSVLYLLIIPQRTSPCPIDYAQVDEQHAEQILMQETVNKSR